MLLHSPILWFGGKGKLKHQLLPLIPHHQLYVEVFGGAASLLFAKPRSPREIYNDVDPDLINFFEVLRDPDKFARFHRPALATPFSRELYNEYRKTYAHQRDPVMRAYQWFVASRQSFGSLQGNSWGGVSKVTKRAGMTWWKLLHRLPQHHERLADVQIDNADWSDVLDRYDSPDTFFYLDPPYVSSTRRRGTYTYEMTDAAHRRLLDRIQSLSAKVLLSGYRNAIYDTLPWDCMDYETVCYSVGSTNKSGLKGEGTLHSNQKRTESMWINYSTQMKLF